MMLVKHTAAPGQLHGHWTCAVAAIRGAVDGRTPGTTADGEQG